MRARNKDWLVALTGVGFVVVGIIGFLVEGAPPSADEPARKIVGYYVDNEETVQTSGLIGIAGVVLLVFFGAYLRNVLRDGAGDGEMLSLLALVGLVIVAIGFAIDITILFALSATAGDVDPVAVQALQALWDYDFIPVILGVLVFLWATGLSVIRSGVLPRWLGWVMVVLGVVGVTPVGFASVVGAGILVPVLSVMLSLRARAQRYG